MTAISFDEEKHEYRLDGTLIPSVTQILEVVTDYANVPRDILMRAAQRGTFVHKAVELHCKGTLDIFSLDEEIADRYFAYVKFEKESRFKPTATEQRVFSDKYRYAGTFDLIGPDVITGRGQALIDIKTTAQVMPGVGPQLAAYEQAYRETNNIRANARLNRYALMLRADGSYETIPYNDKKDWSVFLSALTITRYMEGMK